MNAAKGKKIRVVVIDDSAYNRKVISDMLGDSGQIEVVGTAFDGEDAIRKILRLKPDVVTLDLEMPRMDGFALLRWLMVNHPLPVLVVSSKESNRSVFKAMDLGAVDFIAKPSRTASPVLAQIKEQLLAKLLSIPDLNFQTIKERVRSAPELDDASSSSRSSDENEKDRATLLVVGASTGGPPAIQTLLSKLTKDLAASVLIVQHMPPVFTGLFAERLNKMTEFEVKEAQAGDELLPGRILIAPGGKQMEVVRDGDKYVTVIRDKSGNERFSPSVDTCMTSVASNYRGKTACLILTGMGDDGKIGVGKMKEKGAVVVAESEESAIIYGMPQEVVQAGLADHVDPLNSIPARLADLLARRSR